MGREIITIEEKVILGVVVFTSLLNFLFTIMRWPFTGTTLILQCLSLVILPIYYLIKVKFSHYQIILIFFLIFPIGSLFKMMHWPIGIELFRIGRFAFFGAGVLLLFAYKDLNLSRRAKLPYLTLAITSLVFTLVLFIEGYLRIDVFIFPILLLSSIYLLSLRDFKLSERESRLAKLIAMISIAVSPKILVHLFMLFST